MINFLAHIILVLLGMSTTGTCSFKNIPKIMPYNMGSTTGTSCLSESKSGSESSKESTTIDQPPYYYDLIIVGRGMIGSAAARHAAKILQLPDDGNPQQHKNIRIALVGPSEIIPQSEGQPPSSPSPPIAESSSSSSSPEVYGAHYDEGRITRKTDPDPIWAELAARSIDRYPEILQDATITDGGGESDESSKATNPWKFYEECGHLVVGTIGSDVISSRIDNAVRSERKLPLFHHFKSAQDLNKRFPYLSFPDDSFEGLLEEHDAGYISARGLVAAQTSAAQQMGVHVYDKVVQEITTTTAMQEEEEEKEVHTTTTTATRIFQLTCSDATRLKCHKVLVTSGAFTNARSLLPIKLDLTPIKTQTVHFVISAKDAQSLEGMPSVIFKSHDKWAYILPPILYPDGTIRVKLGGGSSSATPEESSDDKNTTTTLKSNQDVMDWYKSDGTEHGKREMTHLLQSFLPSISPLHIISNACATLHTPTRQAYIGQVSPGWAVGTGGNGFAAKSSDELGRLAALCIVRPKEFAKEHIKGRPASEIFRPLPIHPQV